MSKGFFRIGSDVGWLARFWFLVSPLRGGRSLLQVSRLHVAGSDSELRQPGTCSHGTCNKGFHPFFNIEQRANEKQETNCREGYVFLITVLIIGAISIAVASSMLLLATTAARTALVHQQSVQALAYADTCAERALRALRSDGSYAGSETVAFGDDSCRILSITGAGNENRSVCIEGKSGSVTRRLEISIEEILPLVIISLWKEVANFSLCSS